MAGLKSLAFRLGLSALWHSGAARALAPLTGGCGAVLMLHRLQPKAAPGSFAPNAALSLTPEYVGALLQSLRRERIDILTLDQALQRVTGQTRGRRFVCFTFDDGYRDNLELALPLFRRWDAPFTVYATTGFIERTHAPWWIVLERVIASCSELHWRQGERETVFACGDPAAKQALFDRLQPEFFSMPQAALPSLLEQFAAAHGCSSRAVSEREICTWQELRALRDGGAQIGCHTHTHPVLMQLTAAEARRELEHSRALLARELQTEIRHLAYPYGKPEQAGAREFALAAELGFATATTTRKAALFPAHADHRHAWPRIELTPSFERSPHYLQTKLCGLPLLLWNRGRRVVVD